MIWFAVIILIIAAFAIPALGRALLILLAVIVGIAACLIFYSQLNSNHQAEVKKALISQDEIELSEVLLNDRYSTKLTGKVKNKSKNYELRTIRFKVTFRDCLLEECEIVGEGTAHAYANVPPGQTRYFEEYIYFPNMGNPKGIRSWSYQVVDIEAD